MAETPHDPIKKHQRERLMQIVLPVLAPAGLLILLVVVLFILTIAGSLTAQQIGVAAGCLAIVFVLLPLAILMLIPAALMVLLGFASSSLPNLIRPLLDQARLYTEQGTRLTQQAAERVSEPVIDMRARYERWQRAAGMLIGLPEERMDDHE